MIDKRASTSVYLLGLFGIGLVGIGIYLLFQRPVLLPEDIRYMSLSDTQTDIFRSLASPWLRIVFRVFGGFVIASGILFTFLAVNPFLQFETWSWYAACLAGMTSIGTMTVVNFKIGSDFKWEIFSLAVIWCCALVLNIIEKRRSLVSTGAAVPVKL